MFCTKCGAEISKNAKFCTKCGAAVNGIGSTETSTTLKKSLNSSNVQKIVIFGIVSVIAITGIIVIAKMLNDKDEQITSNNEQDIFTATMENNRDEVNVLQETNEILQETLEDYKIAEDTALEEWQETKVNEVQEDETEVLYDTTEGGIHRYEYFIDDCSWTSALEKARQSGGYLVHINSHEEFDFLISEIQQLGYENIQFRIGGRRDIGSLSYYWADENNNLYGEMINGLNYWANSQFMQGEPSFKDGDIEENCLDFYYYSKEERWVWNDVPDDIISIAPYYSGKIGYIVEYEN